MFIIFCLCNHIVVYNYTTIGRKNQNIDKKYAPDSCLLFERRRLIDNIEKFDGGGVF
jgi:hypothetical protein